MLNRTRFHRAVLRGEPAPANFQFAWVEQTRAIRVGVPILVDVALSALLALGSLLHVKASIDQ